MTREEYIESIILLPSKERIEALAKWDIDNPVAGPTEEIEEEFNFAEEAKTKDSAGAIPTVESTENTESESIDGLSELPKFRSINDVDIFNKKKVDELKIKKQDPNNFEVIKPELFTRIGLELRKEELKKEKELKNLKEKEKDLYLDAKKQISSALGDSIGNVVYDDLETEDQLKIIDLARVQIEKDFKEGKRDEYSYANKLDNTARNLYQEIQNVRKQETTPEEETYLETVFPENPIIDLIGDLYRSGITGYSQSNVIDPVFELYNKGGDTADEEILEYIASNEKSAKQTMQTDEMRDFNRIYEDSGGGIWGFIKGAVSNPTIIPATLISSMATQLGSMRSEDVRTATTVGVVGGGTIGAAAGSIGGPLAGVTAAGGAIAGGFGMQAAAMETALTFSELLQEEIQDELTLENVRELLENEEKLEELTTKSRNRGITIGAIEGLTAGLAKGVGAKIIDAGGRKKVSGLASGSIEVVGGGTGEAAGRLAAGQEMDVREIGLEMVGGLKSSPVTIGSNLISIKNISEEMQINKELRQSNSLNIVAAFDSGSLADESIINIAQNPISADVLDRNIKKQINKGIITKDQGVNVKKNFIQTQQAVNQIKPLNLSDGAKPEIVNLLKEKNKLSQEIKQVNESALTEEQSTRVNEINKELNDIVVKDKAKVIVKDIETLGETFEGFKNITSKTDLKGSSEIESFLQTKIQEGNLRKDFNIEEALLQPAFVIQDPNTGQQEIILNPDVASSSINMSDDFHEAGHAIMFETIRKNPEVAKAIAENLKVEINKIDTKLLEEGEFKERLDQYKQDVADGKLDPAGLADETIQIFSQAVYDGTIKPNSSLVTKLMDFVRQVLQDFGIKDIKFNKSQDVINFVKDYSQRFKDIKAGKVKGLGKGITKVATKGVTGKIITEGKTADATNVIEDVIVRFTQTDKGKQASNKVQEIYDTSGKDGAFEIIEQFAPIVSRIVEKRSEAPNFDRQLLTDEINTGKRGIIDLIAEYKPDSNVPLAAYINKYLPARAIEASQRVLGQEFTTDVTEAKGVIAEETKQPEVVSKKAQIPRATNQFTPSFYEGLKIETKGKSIAEINEEVNKQFDKAIESDLEALGSITSFGQTKNIGPAVAALMEKATGMPAKVFTDKSKNIAKKDAKSGALTNVKQFLNKNAQRDFKNLPDAFDKDSGKATFIPENVKKALYKKNDKGQFVLDKSKTLKDYKKLLGDMQKPVYRASEAQTIKGLVGLSLRNMMFEKAVPSKQARSKTGVKFSKTRVKTDVDNKENISNITNKNPRVILKEKGYNLYQGGKNAYSDGLSLEQKQTRNEEVALSMVDLGLNFFLGRNGVAMDAINNRGRRGVFNKDVKNNINEFNEVFTKPLSKEFIDLNPRFIKQYTKKINNEYFVDKNKVPKEGKIINKTDQDLINKAAEDQVKYRKLKPEQRRSLLKNPIFQKEQKEKIKVLNKIVNFINKTIKNKDGEIIPSKIEFWSSWLTTQTNLPNHPIRVLAPIVFFSTSDLKATINVNGKAVKVYEAEHTLPANNVVKIIIDGLVNDNINKNMNFIKDNYVQGQLLKTDDDMVTKAGYRPKLPSEFYKMTNPNIWVRYLLSNPNINLNEYITYKDGKIMTIAESLGLGLTNSQITPNSISLQNKLILEILGLYKNKDGSYRIDTPRSVKSAKAKMNVYINSINKPKSKQNSALTQQFTPKLPENVTTEQKVETLSNYDKTLKFSRALNTKPKGISVFDFDDTLAKTKEKVIVNKADGTTIEISAAQFAEQASELQEAGATFNFDNFENVGKGTQKGPLADLALKRQGKFGSKDIFVLTARPQIAATDIKMFLDGIGLNLPIENITGLEDGSPQAKATWVISKTAEGYNDFYFADDAIKNVKAVAEILDQVDVKSKVQIAKFSKTKTFDKIINDILEDSAGIKSEAEFSRARAQTVGAGKGKFTFFTTPSAEDFVGLIYNFLGKGKVGDAQFQFFQDNLIDPYNRAEQAVTRAKISAANDFKALKNSLKTLPKSLSKKTGIGGFTFGQAARVAVWTRQGMEVPGLSKRDAKELNDFIDNNAELDVFVDELINIQKGKPYPKPSQTWLAGNITSDIVNEINKVNRKEYMQEFNENIDIIFSDKVMNKLEAAYGPRYVEALRDIIRRMKSGSNRPIGNSRIVDGLLNWLNNSVGAIMFLNTRSAVLQTISAVNFINFGNNNLIAAGKAFANQKQYWKDFMTLFNSPYLVERRDGLKINVSESEIADAVAESSNKPKAFLNLLLNKGFILTRIADSFAIAAGGSTFYRNQVKAYVKSGMNQAAAEKQAFDDFYAIAETSQQSSNPSKISQQQASGAGRVILAFANTPMQYNRIIKRSTQDLINGRGDWKTNVSKIIYYGAMQNLIFNALQTALFALAFSEEDEEQEDKTGRIANGMADSLLRGLGIQGAAVVATKDALITIYKQANKEKGTPEFRKAISDLFGFSPPLDSKVRKLTSGLNTLSWEREKMSQEGFNLNNPAYLAFAQVVSGLTNVPLDRAIQKINNLRAVTSDSSDKWQKVALLMGWSTWDLGLPYYGVEDKVEMTPQMILKEKVNKMKKETSTKQQKETLLKLGLTKQQIKALKYEEARVKKIIELQEKKDDSKN